MDVRNRTKKDMSNVTKLLQNFYPFAKDKLKFDKDAIVTFVSDEENGNQALGKTAYYAPENYEIVVFIDNRHPKDILRSISHELVHHHQNCRGEFDDEFSTSEGYAQTDPHLRKLEEEAYMLGSGIYFRDWEDKYKMSENMLKEWINNKQEKKVLKEGKKIKHDCASHVKENVTGREGMVVSHSLLEELTNRIMKRFHEHAKKEEPKAKENKEIKEKALKETFDLRHNELYKNLMKKFIK